MFYTLLGHEHHEAPISQIAVILLAGSISLLVWMWLGEEGPRDNGLLRRPTVCRSNCMGLGYE